VLDQVQKKVAKFANFLNDSDWEMAQHRHMCCLQSVLWRTGLEGCRWQLTKAILSEQGQS